MLSRIGDHITPARFNVGRSNGALRRPLNPNFRAGGDQILGHALGQLEKPCQGRLLEPPFLGLEYPPSPTPKSLTPKRLNVMLQTDALEEGGSGSSEERRE